MYYPGNYGFVPHTLSEDGDPVDVIVVGQSCPWCPARHDTLPSRWARS
jgi:inorganic pyrophosphatase